MKKGFFGATVLLIAIEIILLLNNSTNETYLTQIELENKILAIEKTGFKRTEAEIYFDNIIEEAILESNLLNEDTKLTKQRINYSIILAFTKMKIEDAGICKKTNSKIEKINSLSLENLSKITTFSKIKIGALLHSQFTISGGLTKNYFPCGKIKINNSTTYFELPVNYSISKIGGVI